MDELKHLCFIDDDQDEIETFKRLYDGAVFTVSSILAQDATDAVSQAGRVLKGATPDLFVLDLYFPLSSASPTSLRNVAAAQNGLDEIDVAVRRLRKLVDKSPDQGKCLLREAHSVVQRSRSLLDDWCKQLNQSPQGGIQLIRQLNKNFPKTPKVFYSRKATLQDAKEALSAGALDILSKPDVSVETERAIELGRQFMDYCNRQPPSFLSKWIKWMIDEVGVKLYLGPPRARVEVSAKKSLK